MNGPDLADISYRRVLRLAIPIVLANLTQPLLGMVDTAIAGHFQTEAALGGVALGSLMFNFIFWGFGFLRMSTTGLVAQAFGRSDEHELKLALWRAGALALALGLTIVAAQSLLIAWGTGLLTDRPDLSTQAILYCRARIWSAPLALGNYVILGYLLGVQRVRTALMLQVIINLSNVVVAVGLVYGLHLGVAGLGASTASADTIGFAAGVVLILRGNVHLALRPPLALLLEWSALRRLLVLNTNLFGRTICLLAVFGWFTRQSAALSVATLAANTVLLNFQTFMAYGLDGFAHACEALVGAAIGARDRRALLESIRKSTLLAAAVAAVFTLVYLFAGSALIDGLTDLAAVRASANLYLPFAAISPLISVWGFQFDGVFIGATHTRELFIAMVISSLSFACASAFLVSLGNVGLWLAFLLFMAMRGITLAAFLPRLTRSVELASGLAAMPT